MGNCASEPKVKGGEDGKAAPTPAPAPEPEPFKESVEAASEDQSKVVEAEEEKGEDHQTATVDKVTVEDTKEAPKEAGDTSLTTDKQLSLGSLLNEAPEEKKDEKTAHEGAKTEAEPKQADKPTSEIEVEKADPTAAPEAAPAAVLEAALVGAPAAAAPEAASAGAPAAVALTKAEEPKAVDLVKASTGPVEKPTTSPHTKAEDAKSSADQAQKK